MSTWKCLSASRSGGSCSLVKKEKQFYLALGTFGEEREPKHLVDIDSLSSDHLYNNLDH